MTRVSFYILASAHSAGSLAFATQLMARAQALGRGLHVHGNSERQAQALCKAAELEGLCVTSADADPRGLSVCHQRSPISEQPILLNLANQVPPFFSRFEEAWEIVCKHTDDLEIGRDKYRFYRDRGYSIRNQQY